MGIAKKIKALAAALLLSLGFAGGAQATIIFNTDTSTELTGSWLAIGPTPLESLSAVAFGPLLPSGDDRMGLSVDSTIDFGTFGIGFPDNPFRSIALPVVDTIFADHSGSFNNNPSNTDVFFLFSGLSYTVESLAFQGDFCFSTSARGCTATVPEPGTLALAALGLLGFFGIGRRHNRVR